MVLQTEEQEIMIYVTSPILVTLQWATQEAPPGLPTSGVLLSHLFFTLLLDYPSWSPALITSLPYFAQKSLAVSLLTKSSPHVLVSSHGAVISGPSGAFCGMGWVCESVQVVSVHVSKPRIIFHKSLSFTLCPSYSELISVLGSQGTSPPWS